MIDEITAIAYENKKLISVDKIIAKSDKIFRTYNKNYLRAEIQQANNAALSAERWHTFSDDESRYMLQYRTAGDERVRDDHAPLNETTLPKSDPFWDSFMPPNGWGCRCEVIEVLASRYEKTSRDIVERSTKNIFKSKNDKPFAFNPGKELKLFPPTASYYNVSKTKFNIINDIFLENAYKTYYKSNNGAIVYVNKFADKSDLIDNQKYAKIITDKLAIDVKIRPHSYLMNVKNPEYEILNVFGDLKKGTSKTSIHNQLRRAKKQGAKIVVFNLDDFSGTFDDAKRFIKGKVVRKEYDDVFQKFILIKENTAIIMDISTVLL